MPNSMGIRQYDYIEFYVGSAKATAYWHAQCLGMKIVAYKGPETGSRDRISYMLQSEQLKIVITSSCDPKAHDIISYLERHGDGVKRFSYQVDNVEHIFNHAIEHGAIPMQFPKVLSDANGQVKLASIRIYDDTEIVFVNYDEYRGLFMPGFEEPGYLKTIPHESVGLMCVDHVVGNVREHEMNFWEQYFQKAFEFQTTIYFGPGDISTQYSALLSKVLCSSDQRIKNPINEPYVGLKKSQIAEYVEQYHGSGVQHVAIVTNDIVKTIAAMRARGVDFLDTPASYYDMLRSKHSKRIHESIDELQRLGVLADVEGQGYLLQLFTKPIGDRPTFFYEIIQRCEGAQGFGHGNFQALFESIEREQAKRGNL